MHGTRPNLFPFLVFALLLATGVILTHGSDAFSQSAATVVAIANMEIGSAPADFKFAKTGQGETGKWAVVADETSLVGRVIEQSSVDRTDYRFPLAIFEPVVAKNIDVSVSFKPVAGRVDQAASTTVACEESAPPLPWASATRAPSTCRSPHSPRSCRTASTSRKIPYIPGWQ